MFRKVDFNDMGLHWFFFTEIKNSDLDDKKLVYWLTHTSKSLISLVWLSSFLAGLACAPPGDLAFRFLLPEVSSTVWTYLAGDLSRRGGDYGASGTYLCFSGEYVSWVTLFLDIWWGDLILLIAGDFIRTGWRIPWVCSLEMMGGGLGLVTWFWRFLRPGEVFLLCAKELKASLRVTLSTSSS